MPIYRYFSFRSSFAYIKFFFLSFDMHVRNWTRTNKHTHISAHPNGNWHEIGLFAVQLCHLSIVKMLTENQITFVCCENSWFFFLFFFFFECCSIFYTIVQMNETKWNGSHSVRRKRGDAAELTKACAGWGRGILKIDDIRMKKRQRKRE